MRQAGPGHAPGARCTVPVRSCLWIMPGCGRVSRTPRPARVREAAVFVAALGASNYTYAEATWTQGLEDWIGAHVRCFTYLGGSLHVKRVAGFSEIRTIIATL